MKITKLSQENKPFPRYFVHQTGSFGVGAYVEVDAPRNAYHVLKNGRMGIWRGTLKDCLKFVDKGEWKEITQEEARKLTCTLAQ